MNHLLSRDCLVYTFSYLRVEDILRSVSLVCRYFDDCCQSSCLWYQMGNVPLETIFSSGRSSYIMQNFDIIGIDTTSPELGAHKMKRVACLKKLESLVALDITEPILYTILSQCIHLKSIHIKGDVTGGVNFKEVRNYGLELIRMDSADVSRCLIEYLVANSPNLKVLEYYSSQNVLKSIRSDNLQCLRMGHVTSSIADLITEKQAKRLSEISIENGSVIPNEFLETLDQFSSLSTMSLVVSHRMKEKRQSFTGENKKVINVELVNPGEALLESLLCEERFPLLQECQVNFKPSFFFRSLITMKDWAATISAFPYLTKLNIGKVTPELLIAILKKAPNLKTLGYSWHHNMYQGVKPEELDAVVKYGQNIEDLTLKYIRFQNDDYVRVISLSCPNLRHLSLDRISLYRPFPSPNRANLLTVTKLERVSIIGAVGTKEQWSELLNTSPNLQYLDIEDCEMNVFYKMCPEDIRLQFNYIHSHSKSGIFPRLKFVKCRLVNRNDQRTHQIKSAIDLMVAALWFINADEFQFVSIHNDWNPVDFRAQLSVKLAKFCPHINKNEIIVNTRQVLYELFQAMIPDLIQSKRVLCTPNEQLQVMNQFPFSSSVQGCIHFISSILM